jgi:hypothetical protein
MLWKTTYSALSALRCGAMQAWSKGYARKGCWGQGHVKNHPRLFTSGAPTTLSPLDRANLEAHTLSPGTTEHLVPMRVRGSVIASSASAVNGLEDAAWDHALVRNGSVKFADSAQLRLRRR